MTGNYFNRKIATALTIVTAGLIVLSAAYIVKEANHDCAGDDCPICVCIEQCLNNFRTLGTATEIHGEIFIVEKFFAATIFLYVCRIVPVTLTRQKVRLDN